VRAVGLFSGIGGIELGLVRAGICAELLCEYWEPAASTLRRHFDVPIVGDIRDLKELPRVDVVAAGFPCTDLSQVGRTAGIEGAESALVREVFRLIGETPPTWLVLENVPNMLTLHGGAPTRRITQWLEEHGWNWAYRTVDSQHFGVRQRRRRVFLVASQSEDPRAVLFADELPTRRGPKSHHAYGFSWTEGNRGLGWGEGVTPTLKGGSKIGIASPPGVWLPGAEVGQAIVRPSVRAGERLQGFRAGWTDHLEHEGVRWRLLGNAVTVPVAEWIGRRLSNPGRTVDVPRRPMLDGRWAPAAASIRGRREVWDLGERPLKRRQRLTLAELLAEHGATGLSSAATKGFATRLENSSLRYRPAFLEALRLHMRHFAAD
jgi:DNA (cytosine-5)-methyltransferase 1